MLLNLPRLDVGGVRHYFLFHGDLHHIWILQRHYDRLILVEVQISSVQDFDVSMRHVLLQRVLASVVVLHCFAAR